MPRLTIIMPAYNADLYIIEAIQSILDQTFRDFELWIIDDGSTDATLRQIETFADERIRKFYHPKNRGRVAVVNELIETVYTEFITITDADDASHPTRLTKQIDLLDRQTEIIMCGTSYYAIDEHGFLLRPVILPADYETIYAQSIIKPQFHGPTTMMRTEAIKRLPDFYRTYFKDNRADADLAARLVDQYTVINLPEPLYYYRIVSNSLSRRNYSVRFAMLDHLIAFLSRQRRATGTDSLTTKNVEPLTQLEAQISAGYAANPARIYQQAAFYHLYWKAFDLSIISSWQAFKIKPFHLKSIFLLLYVLTMSCFQLLSRSIHRTHYKNHKVIF
jgi:glycosyltransferase involved in cell wall biosynthesis